MDSLRDYEILNLVSENDGRTYRARQRSSGREVFVHQLVSRPGATNAADLTRKLGSLLENLAPGASNPILDMSHDDEGVLCFITEVITDFHGVHKWLDDQLRRQQIPAPQNPAFRVAPPAPAAAPQRKAEPLRSHSPGEFTRLFNAAQTGKPAEESLPSSFAPTVEQGPQAREQVPFDAPATSVGQSPGAFTRMLQLAEQHSPITSGSPNPKVTEANPPMNSAPLPVVAARLPQAPRSEEGERTAEYSMSDSAPATPPAKAEAFVARPEKAPELQGPPLIFPPPAVAPPAPAITAPKLRPPMPKPPAPKPPAPPGLGTPPAAAVQPIQPPKLTFPAAAAPSLPKPSPVPEAPPVEISKLPLILIIGGLTLAAVAFVLCVIFVFR